VFALLTLWHQIVPKESAVLSGQEGIASNANHSGLNKYGSKEDPIYAVVRDVILRRIQNLPPPKFELEDEGIQHMVYTYLSHQH